MDSLGSALLVRPDRFNCASVSCLPNTGFDLSHNTVLQDNSWLVLIVSIQDVVLIDGDVLDTRFHQLRSPLWRVFGRRFSESSSTGFAWRISLPSSGPLYSAVAKLISSSFQYTACSGHLEFQQAETMLCQ